MSIEHVKFSDRGVTVTLKITQEQGEVRCTLLLDIEEGSVLGDPYATVSPCTLGEGTTVTAAIADAARGLPDTARLLTVMGNREAGLATLVVSHQISGYAASRTGLSFINPSPKIG